MKVLVDTGATNSIIQQSSLSKTRHRRIYPVQQQFFLANKTSISIIGYVTLEIKIQHIKTHVTAAITKTLCCDVILGEDWIRHYQVTINGFTNKIEVLGSKAIVPLQPSSIIPNDINSCVNHDNLYHKNYFVHYGNQYCKNDCINHHNRYYKSYRVNCGSRYHKINKSISNQHAPKRLPCVNTINNSIPVISSTANDIKTTLDQAVDRIVNLHEKTETRNIIEKYKKIFDTSSPTIALTPIHHTIPTGDHPPINSVPYRGSLQQQQALKRIIDQLEKSNQIRPSSSPWSSPHLNEILSILDKHRFQLNPGKCSIMRTKIDYLGHSIDEHGITPLYDNIKAIRELPIPDHPTLKQANEFIGGLGFYRKFIKNFSKIAAPIHRVTNLTKDNKHKFKWSEEQRQAVQQLKQIITGPDLVLEFPDPKLPYVLSTDASRVGLGAVLKPITENGRIKIIYYLSRVLTNAETRYSTTELEALAIVWAITTLRPYLLGKDFRIETDHCPLCQFHKKRSRNGRLDRWAIEILSEYNITEIKYKKGKCHCDADLLSRYPLQSSQSIYNDISIRKQGEGYLFPYTDELYDNDSGIQPTALINVITRSAARANNSQQDTEAKLTSVYNTRRKTTQLQEKNSPPSSYTNMPSTASSSSNTNDKSMLRSSSNANDSAEVPLSPMGISMRKIKEEQLKDMEIQEKKKNLSSNQDLEIINGILHKLVPRGKRKIKLIWIPKTMINQVLFLHHDHHTAAHMGINKTTTKLVNKTKLPGKMNIIPTPNEVMGLVGMDYWGPTVQSTRNGNKYVITMTDYLSKYVFAKAVRTNSAQEAAEFFLDVCYHYGAPTKLITDQGPHFMAELTKSTINSCHTTHILATPYHPMSNAQTERFNATFVPALSKLMNEQNQDWDELLQPVIYAYNTSQHGTTRFSPFQIMFGRENLLLMDPRQMKISFSKQNQYYEKVKRARKIIIDHAKLNIQHQSKLAKIRYDRNRPDPIYHIDDLVLIRVINKASKLQEKYEGPYRIIDQKGPSTFIVKIEDPDNDYNPNYTKQVTTSDMKPIFIREDCE
ncbi:unnamed protein product [Rotaria sordida]|uniref:RNA-directed DNA polymerase n=1 Tax=Rotaria sordida TaxID=392033 RepID=A0A815J1Y9_9BILA|nr:unnamed protein product [Rotaria sordida]